MKLASEVSEGTPNSAKACASQCRIRAFSDRQRVT